MAIEVTCPKCSKVWWVAAQAQHQTTTCRRCKTAVHLEPHERRVSRHRDGRTGETVTRVREVPIEPAPDTSWKWWLAGAGLLASGIFVYAYWEVVVGVVVLLVILVILGAVFGR